MNKKLSTPHDKVFKETLMDLSVARQFIEEWLPTELQKNAKWETLRVCPNEHLNAELHRSISDILYSLEIAGEKNYLLLLVEHQSTPEALMPFKVLEYQVKIWHRHIENEKTKNKKQKLKDKNIKLPLIYVMVYYHGKQSPYPYSTELRDCFSNQEWADKFLLKPFQLIDLTQIPDEILKKSGQLIQCLTLIQKYILWKKDLTSILDSLIESGALAELVRHPGRIWFGLIKYLEECGQVEEPELFFEKLAKTVPESGEEIMNISTKLIQKGRKEGEKLALFNLLQKKFGDVPENYLAQIEKANSEKLLFWIESVLSAKSLNEVFH